MQKLDGDEPKTIDAIKGQIKKPKKKRGN